VIFCLVRIVYTHKYAVYYDKQLQEVHLHEIVKERDSNLRNTSAGGLQIIT